MHKNPKRLTVTETVSESQFTARNSVNSDER